MRKTLFTLAMASFLLAVPAAAQENPTGNIIELGRPLKARDWLADLADIPTAIVPYSSLSVSQAIPEETPYYRIDPDVAVAAYSYFFNVKSKDAEFVVGSGVNLAKLVHELAVIEELKERSKGKEFASGLADGVRGIGTGLANLVTHPGQSFKSMGKRLRQTGRSIERAVGAEDKVGRDESGQNRSHLGSGPAGQARRALAYQLGVDVYTANPVLQKLLTDFSQVYTAGSFATMVIPYNIGMLNYFNPIASDNATEIRIRDYDPYELRRLVGEELGPILQMDREDQYRPLKHWLMNPNYSPRNTAYIGQALTTLKNAQNLHLVMEELAQADTPEEADMLTLELRLYSLLSQNVEPIVDFEKYRAVFVGRGANNIMYVMFPGDTLRPWQETTSAFTDLLNEAATQNLSGIEIWTIGDVHPKLLETAHQFGVTVHQNALRDQRFYNPQK